MEEIDLEEIFNMFWGKKVYIIVILLIFITMGNIYTFKFTKPIYSSSITLVLVSSTDKDSVENKTITTSDINVNSKLIATYSKLVKSKNVLKEVISNLDIPLQEENLKNNVSVDSVKNTDLIRITVKNEEPKNAKIIADEIAVVFSEKVKELYNINNIQLIGEADIPSKPSNINHKRDIALFAAAGFGVSVILVLILNMLDNTVKTAQSIEAEYDLPVLASIPIYENKMKKVNQKGGKNNAK